MNTTLITLGVIVAMLAIFLTPGFLDFSVFETAGHVTRNHTVPSGAALEEAGSHSLEAFSSLLKRADIHF